MKETAIQSNATKHTQKPQGLAARFNAFCESQAEYRLFWYVFPLVSIPCLLIPAFIAVLQAFSSMYLSFLAISLVLFFSNIIINVTKAPLKSIITLYLATIAFHVIVTVYVLATSNAF